MAQGTAMGRGESGRGAEDRHGLGHAGGAFLSGIDETLRSRGAPVQRLLCAVMMALLALARLPGGGYACQTAMFAVLLRLGFCVPAAFVGGVAGFAGS